MRVFKPFEQLSARARLWIRRRQDYAACFKNAAGMALTEPGLAVIRDLAQFCGAYKSTARHTATNMIDPLAMARAEGRREVYLHIQRRLRLTDEQILDAMETYRE